MNELMFEGTVTEVVTVDSENRYHEPVKKCFFGVVEDVGLHNVRQSHVFDLYGDKVGELGGGLKEGVRVQVSYFFTGYNRSQSGHYFNNERVTHIAYIQS